MTIGRVAVVIASALDKDVAGAPLFRGVSFKLERGDRMTLAGRNGAGKTTLLRMLAGQSSVDGGELVFEKGARIALHDQRPPRETGLTLRDYVLAGCSDLVALEQRLRDLEAEMAERPEDSRVLERYARAQARLEHAGGWDWRARAIAPLHGLGFADEQLDRELRTFSGGELTRASLARALAGDPDLLLLDEPTNHLDIASLEWLEGYLTSLDAAVILVAHDRWFLEAVGTSRARAGGRPGALLPGPLARLAARARRARDRARQGDRQAAARDRPHGALRRALPLQGDQGAPGPVARQGARRRSSGSSATRATRARSASASARPSAPAAWCSSSTTARLEVPGRTLLEDGELWLERGEHVSLVGPNGVGKTTLIEALAERRPLDGGRLKTGPQRQARLPLPARAGAGLHRHRARGRPAGHRPDPGQGARAARPASCSRARRPRSRSRACPAASGAGCRWRCWWHPAPTC